MSANLLNTAAMPGAVPGASVGIAAQAAQSAQGQGPLAGFEAMLAAFFGDQGQPAADRRTRQWTPARLRRRARRRGGPAGKTIRQKAAAATDKDAAKATDDDKAGDRPPAPGLDATGHRRRRRPGADRRRDSRQCPGHHSAFDSGRDRSRSRRGRGRQGCQRRRVRPADRRGRRHGRPDRQGRRRRRPGRHPGDASPPDHAGDEQPAAPTPRKPLRWRCRRSRPDRRSRLRLPPTFCPTPQAPIASAGAAAAGQGPPNADRRQGQGPGREGRPHRRRPAHGRRARHRDRQGGRRRRGLRRRVAGKDAAASERDPNAGGRSGSETKTADGGHRPSPPATSTSRPIRRRSRTPRLWPMPWPCAARRRRSPTWPPRSPRSWTAARVASTYSSTRPVSARWTSASRSTGPAR